MQRKCFQVAIYAPLVIAAQNPCLISLFHCEVAKKKILSRPERYPKYPSYPKYFKSLKEFQVLMFDISYR